MTMLFNAKKSEIPLSQTSFRCLVHMLMIASGERVGGGKAIEERKRYSNCRWKVFKRSQFIRTI